MYSTNIKNRNYLNPILDKPIITNVKDKILIAKFLYKKLNKKLNLYNVLV